jgi:NADH dehydrogenase
MRHVVVVGGGFGGLSVVKALANEPVYVTLVDRQNHHLFQPLLYQVAMAGLSPADIAVPTRAVLRDQDNARVLMGEVKRIDVYERSISLADGDSLSYDYLVVAAGAATNYRGDDGARRHALGLKDLDDAIEIRQRILLAFEAAERESNERTRQRLLTFVVVGGGPTGVELAGALAELSRFVLARDFRHIQPGSTRIILLEGGPRVLAAFDPELSRKAQQQLTDLGVDVRTNVHIARVDEVGVTLAGDGTIPSATVLWAAGIKASPLADMLGGEQDRTGRVVVMPDCSLPGRPDVFVVGDMALHKGADGRPLPAVAPVAIQQGACVAENIRRSVRGKPRRAFHYRDKGAMATIGRSRAVAQRGTARTSGMLAWLMWLVVHVAFLVGFRNRFVVLFEWVWSYFTYGRGGRLVTGRRLRTAGRDLAAVLPREGEPETLRQLTEVIPLHATLQASSRGAPVSTRLGRRAS